MSTQTLSIADLYKRLENSSSVKESAEVITKAFEQIQRESRAEILQAKKELIQEIKLENLATKDDISELKVEMKDHYASKVDLEKSINSAKWQVIGAMFVFFVASVVAKHFGF